MNYVVAVPLDATLAESIGKRGSEDSLEFYNRKYGEHTIVGLGPASIDDKFYAVAEALLVAGQVVVSTSVLDKLFGEVLIACSLLDKRIIFTTDNDITPFLAAFSRKNYEFVERTAVLDAIVHGTPSRAASETLVEVDRAFPVKGVGTVALGIVAAGTVKAHDELYHSSGKKVLVRSIQSQDVDVQEAGEGTRVGLALKGVEADEMEKGDILGQRVIARESATDVEIAQSSFAAEEISKGNSYELVCGFSRSFVTVAEISGDRARLTLEKRIPLVKGNKFLLIREKMPRIFAAGRIL